MDGTPWSAVIMFLLFFGLSMGTMAMKGCSGSTGGSQPDPVRTNSNSVLYFNHK